MQEVYSWLKTVVFFMIFLTIISNLLDKSDFKKYINVVTGLLLVLVTVTPLLRFTSFDESFAYFFDSVTFNLKTTEVANEMKDAENEQRKVILTEYKKQIKEQIANLIKQEKLYLLDANIVIEEDVESDNYAQIKSLMVKATYYVQDSMIEENKDSIYVPKVDIALVTTNEGKEETNDAKQQDDFLSPLEIHVRDILSDFYHLAGDQIKVDIEGG